MRVLFILDEHGGKPVTGGASKAFCEMILALRNGFGVNPIAVASTEDSNTRYLRDQEIEVHIVPYGSFMVSRPWASWKIPIKWMWYLLRYICLSPIGMRRLSRKIDFSTVDIIHTNINRTDFGAKLAMKYHIPHIWHIREYSDLDFKCWSYRKRPGAYISKQSDCSVCVSDAVRYHWIDILGLDSANSCVVHDGVDFASHETISNRDHVNKVRFVLVGNLTESKGQLQVVKAFSLLPESVLSKSTLDLYGSGDIAYINTIQRYIKNSGLLDHVHLKGSTDNVHSMLSQYDVGITSSRSEAFGRVTVEYMMAGLPVVATDAGANRELLTDDQGESCGLFYEFGNELGLEKCLERIVRDEALRFSLSVRGKKRGRTFTARANAAAIYNIYQDLL